MRYRLKQCTNQSTELAEVHASTTVSLLRLMVPEHCVVNQKGISNDSRPFTPVIPGQQINSSIPNISGINGNPCLQQLLRHSILQSANVSRQYVPTSLPRRRQLLGSGRLRTGM